MTKWNIVKYGGALVILGLVLTIVSCERDYDSPPEKGTA